MKRIGMILSIVGALMLTYLAGGKVYAQGTTLDPALAFALSSPDTISLGLLSTVNGPVGAVKNLTVGARSKLSSDADALGTLRVNGFARVTGACASLTQPKIVRSATCGTTQVGPTSPAILPLNTLSTSGVSYCPATGTANGTLKLKRNGTASLTVTSPTNNLPTVFDYKSITLERGAIFTIGGASDGLVVINVSGTLKLGVNASIATGNGLPVSNILIIANAVKLGRRATINASVFTSGSCNLGVNSTINGQVYCKSRVNFAKNATINETQLAPLVAMGVSCPATP